MTIHPWKNRYFGCTLKFLLSNIVCHSHLTQCIFIGLIYFSGRYDQDFLMNCLKQDKIKILEIKILKTRKKQYILNLGLANQEGNENIKMHEIEK